MPRLSQFFRAPACRLSASLGLKMFVPEEFLFNAFLSYQGMRSFSHRSAAFQTQMGFIEVPAALASLMFYGTAPEMCLLLAGCPSTAPWWLRSPGCTQHPWGVLRDFIPKMALLLPFETSPAPWLLWDPAPSSCSHNRHGGWESRDSMSRREEKIWEELGNSAGTHSDCAMDYMSCSGTGRIFTGMRRGKQKRGCISRVW